MTAEGRRSDGEAKPVTEVLDLAALEDRLRAAPVELAVLFGSTATGDVHPFSDVDVAVSFDASLDPSDRRRSIERLSSDLERYVDAEAVDVLDLDRAPPAIGYDALSTGRLLVGDQSELDCLEAQFLVRKLDFEPIKRQYHDGVRRRLEDGSYGRA